MIHELIGLFIQFRKIDDIERRPVGAFVDILGVVESVSTYTTIVRDDGSEFQKRTITLRDDSNTSIELTLWRDRTTHDDRLDGVRLPLNLTHLHIPV
jgi:ssDNA-binding replication factor A large subunit